MAEYIVAHDVGTSANKAVLVDTWGRVHGKCSETYPVHYPHAGWAEQDPDDWWSAVGTTTRRLLEQTGVSPGEVMCLTFSAQMIGIVPMGADGSHLRPAIIWLDNRACRQAESLMRRFGHARIFALVAGTQLCGKDCVPKLLWLKGEEPDLYSRTHCFLDVSGYLLYRTTGNIVMELSGASVFGIDLKKKTWLKGVFRYVGLDPRKLPPLVRSTDRVGTLSARAADDLGLLQGTPVIAGAGDAACAAVGSGAVAEGDGHVYLGTSGWVGVVTERTPRGKCGAATIHSADPDKAFLIAETETAGACLQWIADELYQAEKTGPGVSNIYALMDERVGAVPPGSDRLIFTPWMYGERAPIADCHTRSGFFNLSADHTRENMLRAVYEGVAYNVRWIVEIVEKHYRFPFPALRVIGGAARSEPWMQILSDVTFRKVEIVRDPQEAGAIGAALIAAIGLEVYPGFEALKGVVEVERVLHPREENRGIYDTLFRSYKEAYRSLKGFYKQLNRERIEEGRTCREVSR